MKVKVSENLQTILSEPQSRQKLRELMRSREEGGVIKTSKGNFRLVRSSKTVPRKAS